MGLQIKGFNIRVYKTHPSLLAISFLHSDFCVLQIVKFRFLYLCQHTICLLVNSTSLQFYKNTVRMQHKDFLEVKAKEAIKNLFSIKEYHNGSRRTIRCLADNCPYYVEYMTNEFSEVIVLKSMEHSQHKGSVPVKVLNSYTKVFVNSIIREDLSQKEAKSRLLESLDTREDMVDVSNLGGLISRIKDKLYGMQSTLKYLDSFIRKYNEYNATSMETITNSDGEIESVFIDFPYSRGFSEIENQIFFLDGTHTKGVYKATVLILSCPVCTRNVLPIAILWCPAENTTNTRLLLDRAKKHMHPSAVIKSDEAKCFISVAREFGYRHSLCSYHIKAKIKSVYLQTIFNSMYQTYSVDQFNALSDQFAKTGKITWSNLSTKLDMIFRLEGAPPCFEWESSSPVESINAAIMPMRKRSLFMFCTGVIEWCSSHCSHITKQLSDMSKMPTNIHNSVQRLIQMKREEGSRRFIIDKSRSTKDVIRMVPRKQSDINDIDVEIHLNGCKDMCFPYKSTPRSKNQEEFLNDHVTTDLPVCSCRETSFTGLPCQHLASILPQEAIEKLTNKVWKLDTYKFLVETDIAIPTIPELEEKPSTVVKQKTQSGRPKSKRLTYKDSSISIVRDKIKSDIKSLSTVKADITEFNSLVIDQDEYPMLYLKFLDILTEIDKLQQDHLELIRTIPKRATKTIDKYIAFGLELGDAKSHLMSIYNEHKVEILSSYKDQISRDPILQTKKKIDEIRAKLGSLHMMETASIIKDFTMHVKEVLIHTDTQRHNLYNSKL